MCMLSILRQYLYVCLSFGGLSFVRRRVHISTASVHDSKAIKYIPYESGSYYVFDRGYNAFKELYKIHLHESFFVVRAKKNLQFKCIRWRRRLPKNV